MKLATINVEGTPIAVRAEDETYIEIDGYEDVGALLSNPEWSSIAASANGRKYARDEVRLEPVIPRPGKIICVGANYTEHIREMGIETPKFPTLFAKYAESLIGAHDPVHLPPEETEVDWEGELAVVIGERGRRINETEAERYIAGYSIMNDVSMRQYQFRTAQWLQGKTWEHSTPFGPWLVTPDEFDPQAKITTRINGESVQSDGVNNIIFGVPSLIAYISTIVTLMPGDTIITGTPAGVGAGMKPKRFLQLGDKLETTIEGLGHQNNEVIAEPQLLDTSATAGQSLSI